jgi:TonB family protein
MSDTPPTRRLVIRIKLPPREAAQAPVRRGLSKRALLLIVGAVVAVAVLSVVAVSMFRSEPTPAPSEPARVARPAPAPPAIETKPAEQPPAAPPSPINEVIPDVPRSALDTIRGTIRITIRVVIDRDGTVRSASTQESGPSRYFERLALAAAKKWTFAPADSAEERVMLVRFNFTRAGVTGSARETK